MKVEPEIMLKNCPPVGMHIFCFHINFGRFFMRRDNEMDIDFDRVNGCLNGRLFGRSCGMTTALIIKAMAYSATNGLPILMISPTQRESSRLEQEFTKIATSLNKRGFG